MTGTSIQCSACGHMVDDADRFCPSCGRPTGAAIPHGREDSYLLLMTANVLRLRHQWAKAEAKASELLRTDPDNPAAYSIMGDILRDQSREQDAIEWYKLAVDRDPTDDTDRRKLEALIDRRFEDRTHCVLRFYRNLFGKWAGRTSAELRAARPVCPWAMVTAAIFAIVLLTAFTLAMLKGRPAPPPAPASVWTPPKATSSVTPVPVPPELVGDVGAIEDSLLSTLRRQAAGLDATCRVSAVKVDPRRSSVEIEMSTPGYWTPAATRKQMARMATELAVAALQVEPHLVTVRLRGYARQQNDEERLALVVEGTADGIREHQAARGGEDLDVMFQSVWWEPSLRPEAEPASPGPEPTGTRSGGGG
jgi:hypothetical protein